MQLKFHCVLEENSSFVNTNKRRTLFFSFTQIHIYLPTNAIITTTMHGEIHSEEAGSDIGMDFDNSSDNRNKLFYNKRKSDLSDEEGDSGGHDIAVTPSAKRHRSATPASERVLREDNSERHDEDHDGERSSRSVSNGRKTYPTTDSIDPESQSVSQSMEDEEEERKEAQRQKQKQMQKQNRRESSPVKSSSQPGVKRITQEDRDRAAAMIEQEKRYWTEEYVNKEHPAKESSENKDDMHTVFTKLQTLTQTYGYPLRIPEIIVVGMQSDGKSTFIEALLGFQFNTIDTQIGTRRPLLLQMKNDPSCEEPVCTFVRDEKNGSEAQSTPLDKIEEEIRRRTDERCGPDSVSSAPIILEVRYKYCANLNIYDTPGFRTSKSDPLASKIYRMNMHMMKERHRFIVCLEQSTVEWCNTQIRPIIRKIDPHLERTVFVTTKFNNRVNQFKSESEINGYLSTDGHVQSGRVFFMSLPSGAQTRNLDARAFKQCILDTHLTDYRTLCLIGFDYDAYMQNVGFMRVQRFLEDDLNRRYQKAVLSIINRVQLSLEKRKILAKTLVSEIERMEQENVEQIISNTICSYLAKVHKALEGTVEFDAATNGMTLDEEKHESNCDGWTNYSLDIPVRNAHLKLYGGSQIDRLLAEFEIVAHSQEFPSTSDDEVAVTIGFNSLHTRPNFEDGASDLARAKCRSTLIPLVDVLINRAKFIMKNTFHIVAEHMMTNQSSKMSQQQQSLLDMSQSSTHQKMNVSNSGKQSQSDIADNSDSARAKTQGINLEPFFAALQKASNEFIDAVLVRMKGKAGAEFDTFSRIIDWDLMGYCGEQNMEYDLLNPSHDETKVRVLDIVEKQHTSNAMASLGEDLRRELSEDRCRRIKTVAARLFGGVRLLFVKYIRAKFNSFFIHPIFTEMDQYLRNHFGALGSDNLKELVGLQIHKMKADQEKVARYVEQAEDVLSKFKQVQDRLEELQLKSRQ